MRNAELPVLLIPYNRTDTFPKKKFSAEVSGGGSVSLLLTWSRLMPTYCASACRIPVDVLRPPSPPACKQDSRWLLRIRAASGVLRSCPKPVE